jgi:hypothetical protein
MVGAVNRSQREDLERRFKEASDSARQLFAVCSPAQLAHRPAEGAWSALECVAHLSLTSQAMVPPLEAAVGALRSDGRTRAAASRMDWMGWLLDWSLRPGRFRMKTTAPFQPVTTGPLPEVLPGFLGWQDRIVAALASAEGLDLAAGRIASPFNDKVRYNLISAFRLLETHERRHLLQARRAAMPGG